MEFLQYNNDIKEKWDAYGNILKAPYTFLSRWIDFQVEYSANCMIKNLSFVILQDRQPLGFAKVFVEERNSIRYVGWDGGFLEAPYIDPELKYNRIEKLQKQLLLEIEKIARENGCCKIMLKQDVLSNPEMKIKAFNYNWMSKSGYIDYSIASQMINLGLDEKEIKGEFRKGTKSEIKKGAQLKAEFFDKSSISFENIVESRNIYEYDAGMVTRTSEMIKHYYYLIEEGNAVLGFASLNNRRIATIICAFNNNKAYYLLYAEKTDLADGTSPGYFLQYKVMMWLKEHGVLYYDIGEQVFGDSLYDFPSEKILNISSFKRGFGGYTVPMFRGVKHI